MADRPVPTEIHTSGDCYLDFTDPHPENIQLSDIARALSNTCRFGGHLSRYYSVAEHALLVAALVEKRGHQPSVVFAALHHDSHEAYIGDLPTPLKRALGERYREIVNALDLAVASSLGIDPDVFHCPAVTEADQLALEMEATVMKGRLWFDPPPIPSQWHPGMEPEEARSAFLKAHDRLSGG